MSSPKLQSETTVRNYQGHDTPLQRHPTPTARQPLPSRSGFSSGKLSPMSNRREFFKEAAGAAAGVVFTGCGLLNAAPQSATGVPRRRQVVVGGRRVKTIDIHAHCAVPEAAQLMNRNVAGQDAPLENRLKAMDR